MVWVSLVLSLFRVLILSKINNICRVGVEKGWDRSFNSPSESPSKTWKGFQLFNPINPYSNALRIPRRNGSAPFFGVFVLDLKKTTRGFRSSLAQSFDPLDLIFAQEPKSLLFS